MNQPAVKVIRMGLLRKTAGWVIGWLAAIARLVYSRKGDDDRVVILEPFGMGDVISLVPMVKNLQWLGKQVTICGQARWRNLFDDSVEWLDADVPWATYDDKAKYAFGACLGERFREFRRQLRLVAKGAVGFDPRGDVRSILLLRLAGCSRVISFSCYLGSDMVVQPDCAERAYFDPLLQRWQNNLGLVYRAWAKEWHSPYPRIEHLPKGRKCRCVALIVNAPWKGKLWAPDRWRELRKELKREQYSTVVLYGPGQAETARDAVGAEVEFRECASIEEWAKALSSMSVVVSVDTGPMHLAAALGVRVVGLFGQGLLPLWAPAGEECRTVHHQYEPDFVPCHPIESNAPNGAYWMEKIAVEEVLDAIRR